MGWVSNGNKWLFSLLAGCECRRVGREKLADAIHLQLQPSRGSAGSTRAVETHAPRSGACPAGRSHLCGPGEDDDGRVLVLAQHLYAVERGRTDAAHRLRSNESKSGHRCRAGIASHDEGSFPPACSWTVRCAGVCTALVELAPADSILCAVASRWGPRCLTCTLSSCESALSPHTRRRCLRSSLKQPAAACSALWQQMQLELTVAL